MDLQNVSQIESQHLDPNSSTNSEVENVPPTKKRRAVIQYKCIQTFEKLQNAKDFIRNIDQYTYNTKQNSLEGEKLIYLCKTDSKCMSRMYILLPSTSTQSKVFQSQHPHDLHVDKQTIGIPKQAKEEIETLYSSGITKPKQIMRALVDKGIPTPTTQQLYNFLKRYRQTSQEPILNLGMLEHCINNLPLPFIALDEPFVQHKYFDYDNSKFGIFFTTNRLMQFCEKTDFIQTDATYKLNWNNFPCLVVGTTDCDRHFHPFGLALCSNETSADFKFIFESLKVSNSNYSPKFLIADCASAITNGFEEVFGKNFIRIHCWFHVKSNLEKRLKASSFENKNQLLTDICTIQLSRSQQEFDAACNLFRAKWEKINAAQEFIQYFFAEYVYKNCNWFEGIAFGKPKTNNAIEATNNTKKKAL